MNATPQTKPGGVYLIAGLLLILLMSAGTATAEAPQLSVALVAAEVDRLTELLESQDLGERGKPLIALRDEAVAAFEAGHTHYAFWHATLASVHIEAMLYVARHRAEASSMAQFEQEWREHGGLPKAALAPSRSKSCESAPTLVRSLVEAAGNRAGHYYRAARSMAIANDNAEGGYYYLGQALAEHDLVRLCRLFEKTEKTSEVPAFDAGPLIAGLRDEVAEAYQRGTAASDHHSTFIQINAGLKELEELAVADRVAGILSVLLTTKLRIATLDGKSASDAKTLQGDLDRYRRRLDALGGDNSLARAFVERAQHVLAGSSPEEAERNSKVAAAIVEDVLPTYFKLLSKARASSLGEGRMAARGAEEDPVTVTLLRWPYT